MSKKPSVLAPLLPLTFILAYNGDMAYGSKMNRIKAEAENIMMFEKDVLDSPLGLPTISTLDVARLQQAEHVKYHSISRPGL